MDPAGAYSFLGGKEQVRKTPFFFGRIAGYLCQYMLTCALIDGSRIRFRCNGM